ncbi:MAG TPA: energy transducer TonB [Gemmatimonadales bacterium]|nr:energy transducer TonB [Gemmatimonadales bacterium]
MSRPLPLALAVALLAGPPGLLAQDRASALIDSARAQFAQSHLDSADALLRAALDTSAQATPAERKNAWVWSGVVGFYRDGAARARVAFHEALAIDSTLDVKGLDRLSPELAEVFRQEKEAAGRVSVVFLASHVDEPPRRLIGPPVAYPPRLLSRHVQGRVTVAAIIDTAGRVEPASLEILATPDSGLIEPVRQMMLASQFSRGRLKGAFVRVMVQLGIEVRLPRLSATDLTTAARGALRTGRADSALALTSLALDTTLTHPTDAERAYALLVRGMADARLRHDSAAHAEIAAGEALAQALAARNVDLAPVLRRLVDSLRPSAATAARAPDIAFAAPSAVGAVDEQPRLISHPAIHYPPELAALRVGGTVVVEARLDTTGHVDPQSLVIVQSPNHGLDEEARRAVRESVYRPARKRGAAVSATIRQTITFAAY